MNCVVEERINGIQSEKALVQDTKREMIRNGERPRLNNEESKSSISELFPWVLEFRKMCRCIHTDKSTASFTELMQFYARNVNTTVNTCYTRPLRAAKLKDSISEALMLFLYIYRELPEDCNRSMYLNNMSDLLALYIDMELKASRKSKEDHDKISARLTSCLYVYLEQSTEHLLDTLLKIQFMCRNYHHILDPIITKIMRNIPMHPESSTMYIRYFLIYRLWRKINENAVVKNQITTAAIASLGPLPSTFSPCILEDVLPKVPKNQPNSIKALLQQKFNIKKHCELFIQYSKETDGSMQQRKEEPPASHDSSSRIINSQMPEDISNSAVEHLDSNVNSIISDKNKQNESISLLKPLNSLNLEEQTSFKCLGTFSNNISTKHATLNVMKPNKNLSRRKCKKSNEIVIIDLTSDTVLEKCIKKRKSRKLPWLEEAKKRVDLKIVKASQKIKKKRKYQEDIGHSHTLNTPRSHNHQLENISTFAHPTSNINSEINSNASPIIQVIDSKNKMQIDEEIMDCTQNIRKSIDTEAGIKEINTETSCTTSFSTLNSEWASIDRRTSIKTSDHIVNGFNHDSITKMKSNEIDEDRVNKQTVIKRLIKADIFSKPETCEKDESLNKVCDLGTQFPSVNNTTIHTQYGSKDNANSNSLNINVPNDNVTERVTSSIMIAEDKTLDNICLNEENYASNQPENMLTPDVKGVELIVTQNSTDKTESIFAETLKNVNISTITNTLNEDMQQPCSRNKDSIIQNESESQVDLKLLKCTNTADSNEENKYQVSIPTELRNCNYNKTKKEMGDGRFRVASIKESIFESYSTDKKDVSSEIRLRCPSENIENPCVDITLKKPVEDITNDKCVNKKDDVSRKNNVMSNVSAEISRNQSHSMYKTTEEKDVRNTSKNRFIVPDSELQDNIDGLSLLASVSQHIPHLKAENEEKSDQIKVKDYATLKYSPYSQVTDDENDTNDSSNAVAQLLENPSTEIINRIVGIYPEDVLEKVALHVEVTSNEPETGNSDSELCKVVSHSEENINYDADPLMHNLTPIENNVQTVKENTNVILNGETVVLLQKSPNSNLYIINKAVENSRDHNNDEEISRLKEKNWVSLPDECGQFEASTSVEHASYNLELTSYNKEIPYQEIKCLVGRGKGIKLELEENNFSKPNLTFRQGIKQEFNNISNHITPNCTISGCNGIHSHPHEVDTQHPLHIPVTHPTTLPPIYGNCAGNTDLCVPYHKHCTSVPCSLQINTTTSLHSHTKSGSSCGRSHCSCLNCTYDIVAHCRQCMHPSTDTHVSCIESSPYFLPTHSSVQTPTVQEHEKSKSEAVISKLYDDQLLCKIEKSLLQNNSLDSLDVQCDSEKLFKKDADNKLPLKKRLKAHAMAYEEMPIKAEKVDNYPAIPMMSIAALEALDNTQKRSAQVIKSEYELSPSKKENSHDGYNCNANLVRRDYYKDISPNSQQNLTKESTRKHERQFRSVNDQSGNTVYQESCLQRTFKTPAQPKEINTANGTSLKRFGTESMGQGGTYKKAKKTESPLRQTRSSKRNVPKVNYSYADVDPEWNPSGESKRKRKKTSR